MRLALATVDRTETVDLLNGPLRITPDGWRVTVPGRGRRVQPKWPNPTVALGGASPVSEELMLVSNTTQSGVASAVRAIESLLEKARAYHDDPLYEQSVWLEWQAGNETFRRALIYDGQLTIMADRVFSPFADKGAVRARLELLRHPLWEENYTATVISQVGVSCLGGKWEITGVRGDTAARLWYAKFQGVSGGGGPISRLWCGIRKAYDGTTGFSPLWELESGTAETDASFVSDTGASGGSKLSVSFSTTATLARRWSGTLDDIATSYAHYTGRYLVLARSRVTNTTTTVAVQVRSGYSGMSTMVPGELVYVSGDTAWRMRELGEIQIPPEGAWYGASTSALQKYALELWAERLAGSGALEVDVFVLVPSSSIVTVSGAAIQYVTGDTRPVYVVTLENGHLIAQGYQGGVPNLALDFSSRSWQLPAGSSVLVLVGEQDAGHNLGDSLNIELQYFTRWHSFGDAV